MQRMSETVKPRAARTRATRRRIVDAAAEMFIADGYGTTTLEQIAKRAGVAVQTVYFHFGNKRTVLKEAVDVAAVGDDEQVALLERPWVERVRAEPDPQRVVAMWAANGREIYERVGPIMEVVRDAAVTDPDMAAQWATNEAQRAAAFRMFATMLDERGALNRPLDEAVDVLCALQGPEVYGVLTGRGWTPEQWERFTVDAVTAALLQ
jgi:AcrR family transcriptional regulator